MQNDIESQIVDEIFANSQAYENLQVLADDIGSRVGGSPGELAARDFLVDTLRRYGLDDVRAEAFMHRAWRPAKEELELVAPLQRSLACRCAGLSPSTAAAGVEGEVVFLERGDREELEANADRIRGRFAVAPYYPFARQLKTPLAAQFGAVGLIEHRSYAGGLQPARTCVFARTGDIPVASISLEDALLLRRLEARHGTVRLRLTLDSRIEPKESWNVVGELRGTDGGDELLVVGGHYDTWHVGPGAIDNAAGIVAVLEAARGLARFREHLRRTVRFVLFGVEESGLVGAWAYTRAHEAELNDTVLMINNDVGGRPSHLGLSGFDQLQPILEEVAERVRVEGEDTAPFRVDVGKPNGWGSDHFPFVAHGVPTIGLGTDSVTPEDRFYGHTRADTAEKVYERGLTECAAIDAQVLYTVANLESRPASRKTQPEMEREFRDCEFAETLDLLDLWPPDHVKQRYFDDI